MVKIGVVKIQTVIGRRVAKSEKEMRGHFFKNSYLDYLMCLLRCLASPPIRAELPSRAAAAMTGFIPRNNEHKKHFLSEFCEIVPNFELKQQGNCPIDMWTIFLVVSLSPSGFKAASDSWPSSPR